MILPNTINRYNEITASIEVLRRRMVYAKTSDFDWRKIQAKCNDLVKIDPADGWTLLGYAHALTCNVTEVKRCLANAEALGLEFEDLMNATNALICIGSFKDALELLKRNLFKFDSQVSQTLAGAYLVGGFSIARELMVKGRKMNIELPPEEVEIDLGCQVAEKYGITDELINGHLELAGIVLREFNTVGRCKYDVKDIPGVISGITVSIGVKKTMDEIFEMNTMLARIEDELNFSTSPFLDVAFSYLKIE